MLSIALFCTWKVDRKQPALRYWSLAFFAQTARQLTQLAISVEIDRPELILFSHLCSIFFVSCIWFGVRAHDHKVPATPAMLALLIALAAWMTAAFLGGLPFVWAVLPYRLFAAGVLFHCAFLLAKKASLHPRIGYLLLSALLALLAIQMTTYPFLAPWWDSAPDGFLSITLLFLAIGVTLIVIIQREQQYAAEALAREVRASARLRQLDNERNRMIVEGLNEGLMMIASDGTVITCNPAILRMLRTTPEVLLNRRIFEHGWKMLREDGTPILPSQWPLILTLSDHLPRRGEIIGIHFPSEGVSWFSLNCQNTEKGRSDETNGEGKESEVCILSMTDITARKRAEELLVASERRFRSIFDTVDGIAVHGYDKDRRVIYWNQASETFFGFSAPEAYGAKIETLVMSEADRPGFVTAVDHAFVTGETAPPGEYLSMRKDGSRINVYATQVMIENGLGERELYCIVLDLSPLRRLEAELRVSSERFHALTESSGLGVLVLDAEGAFTYCNLRYSELTRTYPEPGFGHAWMDHVHPDDRPAFAADFTEAVKNRSSFAVDYRVARDDGRQLWGRAHVVPIFDTREGPDKHGGAFQGFVLTIEDTTAYKNALRQIEALNDNLETRVRKRTAELEHANTELAETLASLKQTQDELTRSERLAALGSLVAGIAHDLNTPIGNSVTIASTLADKTAEFTRSLEEGNLRRSTLNTFVDNAHTASDLLLKSLSQARNLITGFKQVAVDQTSDQRRSFDLKQTLEELMVTLSPMYRKTPYRIELDLTPGIKLDSYPGALGQIITNLVSNALAHAFEGRETGTIRIRSRLIPEFMPESMPEKEEQTTEQMAKAAELEFSDDGTGIEEKNLRRIFDPFYTTKIGRGGSGLGLHIVYNITTCVLGGQIQVSSRIGSGTSFTLKIPLVAPQVTPNIQESP